MSSFTVPSLPQNGWPVGHLNAGTAGVKQLLGAPGNGRSHYVTGFLLSGGATTDGFTLLRRDCLLFNAAAETLTMADDSTDFDWDTKDNDGDFSAEFWMKLPATAAAIPNLMTRGDEASDGWNIELTAASLIKFTIHDSSHTATITGTKAIDDGQWHHIVCVVDRSSETGMRIYIDGILEVNSAGDPDCTAVTLAMDGGGTIVMTGVDNMTFYVSTIGIYVDAFLSAATVLSNYNEGVGRKYDGSETGLVVGFNTDEGISTACHDVLNDASNVVTLSGVSWAPSKQSGATAEVAVNGVPQKESDSLQALPIVQTGVLNGTDGVMGNTAVTFPHAIKIGRNNPLRILETDGAFSLVLFGFTSGV